MSFPRPLLIWCVAHLVLWTLIPVFSTHCLPLDSVEAVMWGNAWEWGYDKHPPLSAWVAKIFFEIGLGSSVGVYFLSALCVVLAGIGIYKIARLHEFSPLRATMAVLVLETIYYYQYISIEFNVNILQLPFWAWGWYAGMKGLRAQKSFGYWVLLGVCIGLGALTKYLAVWLLVPLFSYWALRRELGQVLKSPGLYLAGVVSILIFLPHLIWMKNHDFITLTYGLNRAEGEESGFLIKHLWYPLEYTLSQLGILLPALLIFWLGRGKGQAERFIEGRGLGGLAWGGLFFLLGLSLIFGISPVTMWASPMPLAIGLWGVQQFRLPDTGKSVYRGACVMGLVGLVAVIIVYALAPFYKGKPERLNYPAWNIATQVEERWETHMGEAPFQYVVGSEWIGGIVSTYADEHPELMIQASLERNPSLTDDDLRGAGALVIWEKSRKAHDGKNRALEDKYPDLRTRFPNVQVLDDLIIDWPHWKGGLQGRIGLALIPAS